jgi:hypothetical protein
MGRDVPKKPAFAGGHARRARCVSVDSAVSSSGVVQKLRAARVAAGPSGALCRDAANKGTQLSDFSVCTTWRIAAKGLYLLKKIMGEQPGSPSPERLDRFEAVAAITLSAM